MIHSRGGLYTTTATAAVTHANIRDLPLARTAAWEDKIEKGRPAVDQNSKDLVAMMDDQLKRLTKDLVQQQQQKQCQYPTADPHRQSDSLWEYLDSLDRVDLDIDEHLPAPVYFTGDEMNQQEEKMKTTSKAEPKKGSSNGFLPSAFNSIRNLVGNVFRLPSILMGTLNDPDRSSSDQHCEDHLFFDVDDIDFLPETSSGATTASDDGPCEYEAFFLADQCHDHSNTVDDKLQQRQHNYETKQSLSSADYDGDVSEQKQKRVADPLAATNVPAVEHIVMNCSNLGHDTDTTTTTTTTISGPLLDNQSNVDKIPKETIHGMQMLPEKTKVAPATESPRPLPSAIKKHSSSPVNIVKGNNADSETCTRRFISTPDQECSRMAVVRPRKRHAAIKTAVVTLSTPIAVKSNSSTYRHQPRTLYHQTKRTLDKNRSEKRRHEIATNICEDFGVSSDSEAGGAAGTQLSDTDDDELLPLTARNLREPSCLLEFCCESSMNSSTGSLGRCSVGGGGFSVPRRNSINFQSASTYEKEFPVIHGTVEAHANVTDLEEEKEIALVVTKVNGSVYFEIPNSPQRRRMLVPPKLKPLKQRTSSVMSSSVGSSPATSFDAGGKFWGGHRGGRRVRTVSEGSEDDLIEFVSDGCVDYLADVFSDTDDDEDYNSEEESESEDGDEDEEETETETEDEEVEVGDLQLRAKALYIRQNSDLPDSGVEEKKVSYILLIMQLN